MKDELKRLKQELKKFKVENEYLSKDRIFGILTRNGLEIKIREIKKPFDAIFLDFEGLKQMNAKIGYKKVNEIFRNMFKLFDFKGSIGRWFSGDEIVMCNHNLGDTLERFEKHATRYGVSFKSVEFKNLTNLKQLEMLIDKLEVV